MEKAFRREPAMVDFDLWTRIEHEGPGRYLVKVSAIPSCVEQRCAPEERTCVCTGSADAQRAARQLAHKLAADIRARGNRIVNETADFVEAAPLPASKIPSGTPCHES